jgi:hypothetical protein
VIIWVVAAVLSMTIAAFDFLRFVLLIGAGFLGGDAGFRSALFIAASSGAFLVASLIAFPILLAAGYVLFASTKLLEPVRWLLGKEV